MSEEGTGLILLMLVALSVGMMAGPDFVDRLVREDVEPICYTRFQYIGRDDEGRPEWNYPRSCHE